MNIERISLWVGVVGAIVTAAMGYADTRAKVNQLMEAHPEQAELRERQARIDERTQLSHEAIQEMKVQQQRTFDLLLEMQRSIGNLNE